MKSKVFIYTALMFVLIFSSCIKTIDFNGNVPTPQLVMNCIALPDSIIKVNLTRSKFFLSNKPGFTTVDNAIVIATINDTLKANLTSTGDGNYEVNYKPKPNDKIRIDASAPTLESVWAEVTIVPKVTIISIDTTWVKTKDDNNYSYSIYNLTGDTIIGNVYNIDLKIRIKFQDNATEQNYYRLNAFSGQGYYNEYKSNYSYSNYYWIDYDDVVFGNSSEQGSIIDIGSGTYGNNYFTDELINGKEYSLSIKTVIMKSVYFPGKAPKGDIKTKSELRIDLQHLSKSFYLYQKTKNASTTSDPILSEPVQIFSNVKSGMGILASYTSSIVTISL